VSVSCIGKHKKTFSLRVIKSGYFEVLYLARFSCITSLLLTRKVTSSDPGGHVVCSRLIAGIAGSDPAEGIDVGLVCFVWVAASAMCWSLFQRILRGVCI
jgi:hypothetical protein